MRIEIDPAAHAHIQDAVDAFLRDRLGPAIAADAKRFCPKRTGDLADSIEHHLEGGKLVITASGSASRDYAAYVEMGHRIVAWGHRTGRVQPPSPYLRPALFQTRTGP